MKPVISAVLFEHLLGIHKGQLIPLDFSFVESAAVEKPTLLMKWINNRTADFADAIYQIVFEIKYEINDDLHAIH